MKRLFAILLLALRLSAYASGPGGLQYLGIVYVANTADIAGPLAGAANNFSSAAGSLAATESQLIGVIQQLQQAINAEAYTIGQGTLAMQQAQQSLWAIQQMMSSQSTILRQASQQQAMAASSFASSVTAMQGAIAGLSGQMAGLAGGITASVGSSISPLTNALGGKLDAIKNILLTNSFGGTNSITLTSTNPIDLVVTNGLEPSDIQPIVQMAEDMEAGKSPVDAAINGMMNLDFNAMLSAAQSASPFAGFLVPTILPLTIDPPGADFMQFHFDVPHFGPMVVDLNPMSQCPLLVMGLRTMLSWWMLYTFLLACSKLAREAVVDSSTGQQLRVPQLQILGNSASAALIPVYVGLFLAMSVWFVLVFGKIIDLGLLAGLGLNPFQDFVMDTLTLVEMFVPVGQWVSQRMWLLGAELELAAALWILNRVKSLVPS